MNYVLLFLEGIITFISPCILPMLPIYISYFMGENEEKKSASGFLNSVSFVVGFSLIFTMLGAASSTVGIFFKEHLREINILSGSLMIIFGLNYLGVINISFLQKSYKLNGRKEKSGILSSFIFGVVFGVGWTPCVGPFLGSALIIASNSSNIYEGVFMLLSFSLGIGVPFILSALLLDSLKESLNFIKRNYKIINRISGGLLIIIGVMMMTGYLNKLLSILTF